MTTIPFHLEDNRLYFDDKLMEKYSQLTHFINAVNMKAPGTFVRHKEKGRVYFYPPEDYTMPPLSEHKPNIKHRVQDD